MLAAIITPAANPRKIRWTVGSGRLRKKNTVAAPRAVSRAVNPVPPPVPMYCSFPGAGHAPL